MSEKNNNKKTRRRFREIWSSEKFLALCSLMLSFIIWLAVASSSGEVENYTINDIPVDIELSDEAIADGLTVVSVNDVPVDKFTVSVKVAGNSLTIGSLTSSDIQVSGSNMGNIVTSGTYNVSLTTRAVGFKSNYSIKSITPSEVTVVVDRNIEKELPIESQITASTTSDYYMGSPTFSSKNVIIKGPEQSVSKVARVVVVEQLDRELTNTVTIENLNLTLLDANNKQIEDSSLIIEPTTVDVTIPILPKKTVPIDIVCENRPMGLDLNSFISIEPKVIEIAASEDIINTITSISVGPLNFNTLKFGTGKLDFEIVMPEGVRNLNNIEKATVQFNFNQFGKVTKNISAFQFANVPDGLVASYSPYSSIDVTFIGPKDDISKLSLSDISAIIDMSDSTMGNSDVPVTVRLDTSSPCWVYGTYSVNVTVTDQESAVPSTGITSASDNDEDHQNPDIPDLDNS